MHNYWCMRYFAILTVHCAVMYQVLWCVRFKEWFPQSCSSHNVHHVTYVSACLCRSSYLTCDCYLPHCAYNPHSQHFTSTSDMETTHLNSQQFHCHTRTSHVHITLMFSCLVRLLTITSFLRLACLICLAYHCPAVHISLASHTYDLIVNLVHTCHPYPMQGDLPIWSEVTFYTSSKASLGPVTCNQSMA